MTSSASTVEPPDSPSCSEAASPCVDVCQLDSDFVCIGCGRTIDEVLKWPEYTDEQKQKALDRIFGEN